MYRELFDVSGKTALVTGGWRGIGLACCEALGEAGAKVIVNGTSAAGCAKGVTYLRGKGIDADVSVFDVTDSEAVNRAAEELSTAARVDILVNNAGIARGDVPAEDLDDERWLAVMDVNLNGTFRCARAFGRAMLARQSGVIVNVGSISGEITNRPQTRRTTTLRRRQCTTLPGRSPQNGQRAACGSTRLRRPTSTRR